MLELKARFTLALIFTTCPTLRREKQEIQPSRGTDGENRGLRYLWGLCRGELAKKLYGVQSIFTSMMLPKQVCKTVLAPHFTGGEAEARGVA